MTKPRAQIAGQTLDEPSGVWPAIVKEIGTAHGSAIHAESIVELGTMIVV